MALNDLLEMIPGTKEYKSVKGGQKKTEAAVAPKSVVSTENIFTTESILPFDDIIGKVCFLGDNQYAVVAKTNAISIDEDEEIIDHILLTYHKFNATINYTTSIYIPSYNYDLKTHFDAIDKRLSGFDKYETVESRVNDYKENQSKRLLNNDITETLFYVIFNCTFRNLNDTEENYKKASKILSKKLSRFNNVMKAVDIKAYALEDNSDYNELTNFLYEYYYPEQKGKQTVKQNNDVSGSYDGYLRNADRIEKEIEDTDGLDFTLKEESVKPIKSNIMNLKNKISPYSINYLHNDHIIINDVYMTFYEAYDFEGFMSKLWANELYQYRNRIDFKQTFKPMNMVQVKKNLNNNIKDYNSYFYNQTNKDKLKSIKEMELQKKAEESKEIIKIISSGQGQKLFDFSFFIRIRANTLEELNDICLDVEGLLQSAMVNYRKTTDNMINALKSMCPIGRNHLGSSKNMFTSGITNAFPLTNFCYSQNTATSFLYGQNRNNNSLVYAFPWNFFNPNIVVLGASGSGKSVLIKYFVDMLTALYNAKLDYLDVDGETLRKVTDPLTGKDTCFAEYIGANVYHYFNGSKEKINIFDLTLDDDESELLKNNINFVKMIIKLIDKNINEDDQLDFLIRQLYLDFGFTDDKSSYYSGSGDDDFSLEKKPRKTPELFDLYSLAKSNNYINEAGDTTELAKKLKKMTREGSISMFDGQSTIDFSNKRNIYVTTKLKDIPELLRPAILILSKKVFDWSLKNPDKYNVTTIDESHTIINSSEECKEAGRYIEQGSRRNRKLRATTIFGSQQPDDYASENGQACIDNASCSFIMKMKKKPAEKMKDLYYLNKKDVYNITKFIPEEGECYLLTEDLKIPLNIIPSDRQLAIFNTK
jgi:hypothetical protein